MSGDGAHAGYSASQAMGYIIGGQPLPEQPMTAADMRDRIMSTDLIDWWQWAKDQGLPGGFAERTPEQSALGNEAYGRAADALARVMLEAMLADPRLSDAEDSVLTDTLRERLTPEVYEVIVGQVSGFQWGWARNAARRCLELGPLPNPALIEVRADV